MTTSALITSSPEKVLALLAAIVESSEDAIISKTLDGTILTWNTGAEQIYGYPAVETIGRQMTILLPEDRLNEEQEILDRIGQGQRVEHFDTVRRKKDGTRIDVSLTISPVRDKDGRVAGASHVARDITDRKQLELRLQRLAAVVESSDDAIISKTLDGIILTWNRGAERLYGYPTAETIGRHMSLLLPEDRSDEEAELLRRIGTGERVEHFETVRKTRDGGRIDVSLTISPVRDKAGRIIGASHVARNITDRMKLDQQLRHSQKLESLGVLAGGVAHDFNNLLTGILGNTSLALETISGDNPARNIMRDVLNASERASRLTRQLLAYAGKGQFVIEPINISGLVREISNLIQTSIPKNVQLRLELRNDIPCVEADSSQLQQVIMNLVINGAESIGPEENGTVLVTTGAQTVDGNMPQLAPGTYVTLEVHDSGCGMDEATVNKIFDPFFTTKFVGRGLGLAAVQGIVQGHRGAMKVSSRVGLGTTFQIFFPATEMRVEKGLAVPARTLANNELILVIDDEDVIRRTAKAMLERYGYRVILAENGKEGVELFQVLGDGVAAVLLDMTMPVMNGDEAYRKLKELNPEVRVVLSSGYDEAEAVRQFTGKDIAGFIQKPYSTAALTGTFSKLLEKTAAQGM